MKEKCRKAFDQISCVPYVVALVVCLCMHAMASTGHRGMRNAAHTYSMIILFRYM